MEQLRELLISRKESLKTTICIIDNAPIHVSNEAKKKISEMEMQLLSICPYSPSLNPIEDIIGVIE